MNSYTYSPPMHHGDPYRHSVSMAPTHSISLPPLRPDGHIQQPQAYVPSSQMSSPPMATYYAPQHSIIYHGQHMSHMPPMGYRQYGIPITHSRPPKKEIKRRTKTGCMTCRKRRIKCDEQKPVCRNCVKSKRDCLGYDPMHKNQPGSGGASLRRNDVGCCGPQQPAHHHPSSPRASTPSASTTIASSPTTTASTGITTPTSSMFYTPASANSSFSSTASFSQPTYQTAPISQPYPHSPVHQAYSTAPLSQPYTTPTLSHFYPPTATTQTYTLPSPLPSSKTSHMSSYFQNSSPEPLHAITASRHLPTMGRPHGVAIY